MKLLRFGERGAERPGMLDGDGSIRDLSGIVADLDRRTIGDGLLERLRALDPATLPLVEGRKRIGACVGDVGKFVCIGLNYADHAAETGAAIPSEPILFAKWTSAICGPDDDVEIPRGSVKTDWEVELGVVIGRVGRYIEEEDALEHVFGYCVVNDVSEREFQMERGGTWDKGKGHDTFGPIGPWLVTRDEVADPQDLRLWLEVDGERMQDGTTGTMIFGVRHLVSYLSRFMSLQAGDVISTGTPPGVGIGKKPPRFLRAGMEMRLGVERLGSSGSGWWRRRLPGRLAPGSKGRLPLGGVQGQSPWSYLSPFTSPITSVSIGT